MRYPHTATIKALTPVGTKSEYITSGTTECFLQPLDPESSTLYSIVLSKAFACYLPITTTLPEKGRLEISGATYSIKGRQIRDYGTLAHTKTILELLS